VASTSGTPSAARMPAANRQHPQREPRDPDAGRRRFRRGGDHAERLYRLPRPVDTTICGSSRCDVIRPPIAHVPSTARACRPSRAAARRDLGGCCPALGLPRRFGGSRVNWGGLGHPTMAGRRSTYERVAAVP
jgi:hypothetical protein